MSEKWKSQCTTCQYYNDTAGASNCLRYPPQVVSVSEVAHVASASELGSLSEIRHDRVKSQFPAVEPDDWCGEYQPEKAAFREYMKTVDL